MNETWTWFDFFLNRYMIPLYAIFFIFVGLSIENRTRRKRAEKIIRDVITSLQTNIEQIEGLTCNELFSNYLHKLSKIVGYKNSDLIEFHNGSLKFRFNELSDPILRSKMITNKIISNNNSGVTRYHANIPGGKILMQNINNDLILAVKISSTPFPDLDIFRIKN